MGSSSTDTEQSTRQRTVRGRGRGRASSGRGRLSKRPASNHYWADKRFRKMNVNVSRDDEKTESTSDSASTETKRIAAASDSWRANQAGKKHVAKED